jgi:hypothetical protein
MKKGYAPLLTLALMTVPTFLWATTAPQDKTKQTTGGSTAQAPTKPATPPTTPTGTAKIVTPGQTTPVAPPVAPTGTAKIVTPTVTKPTAEKPAPDDKAKPAVFSQETHDKLKAATFKDEASAPTGMAACPTFKRRPGFLKRVKGEGAKTSYEPTGPSWTDEQKNVWYVIDQSATEAASLLDKKAPKKPYFATKKPTFVSSSVTRTDGKAFSGCKYTVTNKKDVGRQTKMVFVLYPVK